MQVSLCILIAWAHQCTQFCRHTPLLPVPEAIIDTVMLHSVQLNTFDCVPPWCTGSMHHDTCLKGALGVPASCRRSRV